MSWFDCLGEPVPERRVSAARKQAIQMGVDDIDIDLWLRDVAKHIQYDRPAQAIDKARERLDITGTYRLLGYLCADPRPHPYRRLVEAYGV